MPQSGFLLVDKPVGWTSHDVVAKVRKVTGIKKVGHGGTLDPLATGLLVIGLGSATKQLERFVQGDKTYLATVRLGATSTTDDAEGEITEITVSPVPSDRVEEALRAFEGQQEQLPPVFSAIKTGGQKHYEMARKGKPLERSPRPVTIHSIGLISYDWPDLEVRCTVSKGTYIRALARDIGETLGTGGYLLALRREAVGTTDLANAITPDALAEWRTHLLPIAK